MIELGKKQTLQVVKTVDFGVYLAEDMNADTKHQVLLPAKQVPAGTKAGDKLEVFIYKDSQDRMIATTNEPRLTVGEAGLLRVKQVTKIGAFLDWGLEKDLLLPYHEQTTRIFEGQECLVAVYVDKSSRLCATAVDKCLATVPLRLPLRRQRPDRCCREHYRIWIRPFR